MLDRAIRTCGGDLRTNSTSTICTYSVQIAPALYVRKSPPHVQIAPALYVRYVILRKISKSHRTKKLKLLQISKIENLCDSMYNACMLR
jgi:hypothetical protein